MKVYKKPRNYENIPPLLAAPICGFSRFPFRKILQRTPVSLIFTEMVSIDALYYKNPKTFNLLHIKNPKKPIGVQLVGSKINLFLKAVERI